MDKIDIAIRSCRDLSDSLTQLKMHRKVLEKALTDTFNKFKKVLRKENVYWARKLEWIVNRIEKGYYCDESVLGRQD